jgi:4-amino-4-deoxy-L-arabinose transferase-like glycosyltransferase
MLIVSKLAASLGMLTVPLLILYSRDILLDGFLFLRVITACPLNDK